MVPGSCPATAPRPPSASSSGPIPSSGSRRSRERRPLAERVDALIIGGGGIGASIAYHLTLRGLKPVVFDKDLLGSGNTRPSPGGIPAQVTTQINIQHSPYPHAFY